MMRLRRMGGCVASREIAIRLSWSVWSVVASRIQEVCPLADLDSKLALARWGRVVPAVSYVATGSQGIERGC